MKVSIEDTKQSGVIKVNNIIENFQKKLSLEKKNKFLENRPKIKKYDEILRKEKILSKSLKVPKKLEDLKLALNSKEENNSKIKEYKNLIKEKYLLRCTNKSLGVLNQKNLEKKAESISKELKQINSLELDTFENFWRILLQCAKAKAQTKLFGKSWPSEVPISYLEDTFFSLMEQNSFGFKLLNKTLVSQGINRIQLPIKEIEQNQSYMKFLITEILNRGGIINIPKNLKLESRLFSNKLEKEILVEKVKRTFFEIELTGLSFILGLWMKYGWQFESEIKSFVEDKSGKFFDLVTEIEKIYKKRFERFKELNLLEESELKKEMNFSKRRFKCTVSILPYIESFLAGLGLEQIELFEK